MKLNMPRYPIPMLLSLIILFLVTLPICLFATDYYVKIPGNGGNDENNGLNWNNAKATIEAAMALADGNDMIHVASGVYTENINFPEADNIQLLGGYPAAGGYIQNPWDNRTVVDGGAKGPVIYIPGDFEADKSFRGIVIDGFVIKNGSSSIMFAAGIESGSNNITIKRCTIENNICAYSGFVGGIYIQSLSKESSISTLKIEENIIRNNSGPGAGAIVIESNNYLNVELTNNLIYGNDATDTDSIFDLGTCGGIIIGIGNNTQKLASAKIINCTIADNHSAHLTKPVGGLWINLNSENLVEISNSIIWHPELVDIDYPATSNVSLSYCAVEDSDLPGQKLIHTNPAFINPSDLSESDYHLAPDSPCIDTGTSVDAPGFDLDGVSRPQGTGYDMGAFEYVFILPVLRDAACFLSALQIH